MKRWPWKCTISKNVKSKCTILLKFSFGKDYLLSIAENPSKYLKFHPSCNKKVHQPCTHAGIRWNIKDSSSTFISSSRRRGVYRSTCWKSALKAAGTLLASLVNWAKSSSSVCHGVHAEQKHQDKFLIKKTKVSHTCTTYTLSLNPSVQTKNREFNLEANSQL